jgi:hypothetical protein
MQMNVHDGTPQHRQFADEVSLIVAKKFSMRYELMPLIHRIYVEIVYNLDPIEKSSSGVGGVGFLRQV